MSTNEAGDHPSFLSAPQLAKSRGRAQGCRIVLDNLVTIATILPSRGNAAGATGAQRGKQYG
jgi:hypothetical protein